MATDIRANHVYVAPLRERYLELHAQGEITSGLLARRLGWTRRPSPTMYSSQDRVPDGDRVKRTLGLRKYKKGKGYGMAYREQVTYDMAVKLAKAMGADPWEFDL